MPQNPNSVSRHPTNETGPPVPHPAQPPPTPHKREAGTNHTRGSTRREPAPPEGPFIDDSTIRAPQARRTSADGTRRVLLRKEVIQPHLPVRLPCYDFVPIASPTFDHSPPKGLGRGLRVLPTFVT